MKKIKKLISMFAILMFTMLLVSCSSSKAFSIFGNLENNSDKVIVTFLVEGNAEIIPSRIVDPDTIIQLPDAQVTDNAIKGWSEISPYDPVPMNIGTDYTVSKTVILYAVMEKDNTAMVIFNVAGDIALVIPKYIQKNNNITLPSAVVSNHTMKGWSETDPYDNNPLLVGNKYFVTQTIILYAVLEKKPPPYEFVTTQFSVNGVIDDNLTCEVEAGTSFKLPFAKPNKSDLTFAGWTTDAEGGGIIRPYGTSYAANKNETLYAKFTTKITVVFSIDGNISAIMPMIVEPGSVITLPQVSSNNGKVIGWVDVNSPEIMLPCGSEYTVTLNTVLIAIVDKN